jgi:hypothetical protein
MSLQLVPLHAAASFDAVSEPPSHELTLGRGPGHALELKSLHVSRAGVLLRWAAPAYGPRDADVDEGAGDDELPCKLLQLTNKNATEGSVRVFRDGASTAVFIRPGETALLLPGDVLDLATYRDATKAENASAAPSDCALRVEAVQPAAPLVEEPAEEPAEEPQPAEAQAEAPCAAQPSHVEEVEEEEPQAELEPEQAQRTSTQPLYPPEETALVPEPEPTPEAQPMLAPEAQPEPMPDVETQVIPDSDGDAAPMADDPPMADAAEAVAEPAPLAEAAPGADAPADAQMAEAAAEEPAAAAAAAPAAAPPGETGQDAFQDAVPYLTAPAAAPQSASLFVTPGDAAEAEGEVVEGGEAAPTTRPADRRVGGYDDETQVELDEEDEPAAKRAKGEGEGDGTWRLLA